MKKNKKTSSKRKKGFTNKRLEVFLLAFFRENPRKNLNYKQLAKRLNIKDSKTKKEIIVVLGKLKASGYIKEESIGSFRLLGSVPKTKTTVTGSNSRGVFVFTDKEKELFIPKEFSLFSMPGDVVEVLFFYKKGRAIDGEVVNVVSRQKTVFVGEIDFSSNNYFLIPDDKRAYFDVFLPPKTVKKTFLQKKVLVEVNDWEHTQKNPVGKVISIIGDIKNHDTQIHSILYDYGFSPSFPKKVALAARKIDPTISQKEIKNRLDARKKTTFTIDPEDAKDFDDALSVTKLKNDLWEVGVHIADVSHYVPLGGTLDKEAFKRATSVYLVDRVVPMLPEIISNDLCSLKPNIDRLAYSVFFKISEKGVVLDYVIKKTIIHSDMRFSYKNAQLILKTKKGLFSKELLLLEKLSKILKQKRLLSGSINFKSSEVKFVLDKKNNPLDVYFKESLSANHLIEEFMLLANKTVSKHIAQKNKKLPFVYRVHDVPDQDKILALNNIVKKFGYKINSQDKKTLALSINKLLSSVSGKKEEYLIETLAIRSMSKAVYSTKNIGHYGLGFNYYSHFTSPIRRYPDLITHRLLNSYLSNSTPISVDSLEKQCLHCSLAEKTASSAERDSIKFMQVKFLKNKLGVVYDGVISGVTEWGLYVELSSNKCEGLVRISSIKDDHYVYSKKDFALTGFRKKIRYQLGQKVKVKVKKADLEKKQLDFILV